MGTSVLTECLLRSLSCALARVPRSIVKDIIMEKSTILERIASNEDASSSLASDERLVISEQDRRKIATEANILFELLLCSSHSVQIASFQILSK